MKTPQEVAQEVCQTLSRDNLNLTNFDVVFPGHSIIEPIAQAIAAARAEGYKAGVRARDEWTIDKDATGARDRALVLLGIDQNTLLQVKL